MLKKILMTLLSLCSLSSHAGAIAKDVKTPDASNDTIDLLQDMQIHSTDGKDRIIARWTETEKGPALAANDQNSINLLQGMQIDSNDGKEIKIIAWTEKEGGGTGSGGPAFGAENNSEV